MSEINLELLYRRIAALEAHEGSANRSRVASGGGGPYDPGMEPRVAKLEADVGHIRTDVGEIKRPY
jgi:hypothetical protein